MPTDRRWPDEHEDEHARGRLTARPAEVGGEGLAGGLHRLGIGRSRDGLVYVPASARGAAPLLVMLHGAGADGSQAIHLVRAAADARGVIVLAPDARGPTWDLLRGRFGVDVRFLDEALAHVFARHAIDAARIGIGGFSDGASYALSLGLANGDLFALVLAFSPGFVAPLDRAGAPRIYVSHGRADAVLPLDRCSGRIVPALVRDGYDVHYDELDAAHEVPAAAAARALDRLIA